MYRTLAGKEIVVEQQMLLQSVILSHRQHTACKQLTCNAPWSKTISNGESDVILSTDVKNVIPVSVAEVLLHEWNKFAASGWANDVVLVMLKQARHSQASHM